MLSTHMCDAVMSVYKAVGYIKTEYPDLAAVKRWKGRIQRYCAAKELPLGAIYVDNGMASSEMVRAGFAALLVDLSQTEAGAVVIPSLEHLSDEPIVREALRAQILRSGAIILALDERA